MGVSPMSYSPKGAKYISPGQRPGTKAEKDKALKGRDTVLKTDEQRNRNYRLVRQAAKTV